MVSIYSVLRRTGLNQFVLPFALLLNNIVQKGTVDMDTDTAYKILNQYYEDSRMSSIRSVPKNVSDSEYDIAVVIPCYRCEDTILRCLDSCMTQKTNADFKVIAVDDGSPDSTGVILDEYADSCDKLFVIHQENSGAGGARNSGLNLAKSKYIIFVDADDFLPDCAIENLFSTAEHEKAYIVQGSFSAVNAEGNIYRTDKVRGGTQSIKGFERLSLGKNI